MKTQEQQFESACMWGVMAHYGCSSKDAERYLELRDEGYGRDEAALMAGIADTSPPTSTEGRTS